MNIKHYILVTFIGLFSQNNNLQSTMADDMKSITVLKGNHFVRFQDRILKYRRKPAKVAWLFKFDENANYNHGDNDQLDWNKLTGLTYHFYDNLAETVMIGWRYNIEADLIELNAYYHVDSGRDFTLPLLSVKRGEQFEAGIKVDYKEKLYSVYFIHDEQLIEDNFQFNHNNTLCRQINFYFGGNKKAPQDVTVYMKEL